VSAAKEAVEDIKPSAIADSAIFNVFLVIFLSQMIRYKSISDETGEVLCHPVTSVIALMT
jgi:hypothetical protein